MSFCLTSDLLQSCLDKCSGGTSRFWLAPADAVVSITEDGTNVVTAISMSPAVPGPEGFFYEFEGYEETTGFTETLTGQAPNTSYEQVLTSIFRCRSQEKRNVIEQLRACSCGLVVIHEEASGKRWIWGLKKSQGAGVGFSAKITGNEAVSGVTLEDFNQETITLTAKTTEKARELDAAVVIPVEP